MKTTLQIIALLALSLQASAKCSPGGLNFWPKEQSVKQNSIFLIEGYSNNQEIIAGLGKEYKIFLHSKTYDVFLIVDKLHEGDFLVTQAILKPTQELIAGETYKLVILDNSGNLVKTQAIILKYIKMKV